MYGEGVGMHTYQCPGQRGPQDCQTCTNPAPYSTAPACPAAQPEGASMGPGGMWKSKGSGARYLVLTLALATLALVLLLALRHEEEECGFSGLFGASM